METIVKICGGCKEIKSNHDFYVSKIVDFKKCKECIKLISRQRYKNNKDYRIRRIKQTASWRYKNPKLVVAYTKSHKEENPEAYVAYGLVKKAIMKGILIRKPCEVCNDGKSQAHHDDYSKPLDVRWLCGQHHRQVHGRAVLV